MSEVKIGDVVWKMRGRRRNKEIVWSAHPMCIDRIEKHMYWFSNGEGCSFNGIGRSFFLTREEAIENFLKTHEGLTETIDIDAPTPKGCAELMRTDWQDYKVPRFDGVRATSVYLGGFNNLKNYTNKLEWRKVNNEFEPPETEYLTLAEIYEQVKAENGYNGSCPLITVFVNDPMRTQVFQCNNYENGKWVRLGDFMGYA